jgi:hypothetical protein
VPETAVVCVQRLIFSQDGKFWRFCFGVYGFALQNPKQFAGFLERFIGDWLPPFEQAWRRRVSTRVCGQSRHALVGRDARAAI